MVIAGAEVGSVMAVDVVQLAARRAPSAAPPGLAHRDRIHRMEEGSGRTAIAQAPEAVSVADVRRGNRAAPAANAAAERLSD